MPKLSEHSYEEKLRKLDRELVKQLNGFFSEGSPQPDRPMGDIPVGPDFGLMATYGSSIIVKDYDAGKLYEMQYSENGDEITFGQPQEVSAVYVKKQLAEQNPNASFKDVQELIDTWQDWAGGFTECVAALADKPGIDNPEALCAWLHYQAEGKWPAENAAKSQAELTGPIVMKNEAKRIAYAAVLVPGEPDADGEVLTEERVEKAAHEWMEYYRNVDLQHTLNNVGLPVESYLLPMDMSVKSLEGQEMSLPKGAWILGSKADEPTWEQVQAGKLTGYSVMGIKRSTAGKSQDAAAYKRTLLEDLGDDWIAAFVSFVDEPAVPKAKFFALKSKQADQDQDQGEQAKGLWSRFVDTVTGKGSNDAEKAGRRFSDSVYGQLKQAAEALQALVIEAEEERKTVEPHENINMKGGGSDMDENKVQEMIDAALKAQEETMQTAVSAAIKGLEDKLAGNDQNDDGSNDQGDQGSNDQAGKGNDQGDQSAGNDQGSNDQGSEMEAFKAQVMDKLEQFAAKIPGEESRSIKGQDGGEPGEDDKQQKDPDRDFYGRKRKQQ